MSDIHDYRVKITTPSGNSGTEMRVRARSPENAEKRVRGMVRGPWKDGTYEVERIEEASDGE